MDVTDLHDFVQLFDLPTKPTNKMTEKRPAKEIRDTSSSNSSVTLPLPAHTMDNTVDLEKLPTAADSPAESSARIVTALDWTGPDDPENAENWSTAKKAYHIAYVGLMCFVMYVSTTPEIARMLTFTVLSVHQCIHLLYQTSLDILVSDQQLQYCLLLHTLLA